MFGKSKKLKEEVERLNHQIKLMQEHIHNQKTEIGWLQTQLNKAQILLDISNNTKRY